MIRTADLLPIAKLKGLSPRLAELDYLQDVALINIYREFGNRLVFKGGTCLYKVYKMNRFSEDLDFSGRKGFKPREFFRRLPYFFNLLDIKSTVRVEQFAKGINVYLEVLGPLYDGRKETRASLIFNISLRERVMLPVQGFPYASLYPEVRSFDLFVMDEKEILAEKVRTIYGRNKARDVYDFWYLLEGRGVVFDAGLANKKLSYDSLKFGREKFLAKIDEKRVSWERDLAGLVGGELPPFVRVRNEVEQSL
jgi:predicted nucleotidyltransferase component of viral defense system